MQLHLQYIEASKKILQGIFQLSNAPIGIRQVSQLSNIQIYHIAHQVKPLILILPVMLSFALASTT